jgi:hypothetical protein
VVDADSQHEGPLSYLSSELSKLHGLLDSVRSPAFRICTAGTFHSRFALGTTWILSATEADKNWYYRLDAGRVAGLKLLRLIPGQSRAWISERFLRRPDQPGPAAEPVLQSGHGCVRSYGTSGTCR